MTNDWQRIEGWFTPADNRANTHIARAIPDGGTVVCLGVWHGRSLVALAAELAAAGKTATIVAIDLYPKRTLPIALANLDHWPDLWIVRADIVRAASPFAPRSIDAIYIDAGHDYETSRAALLAWLPKVKPGGIVSGHDYQPHFPGIVRAVHETLHGLPITLYGTSYLVRLPA